MVFAGGTFMEEAVACSLILKASPPCMRHVALKGGEGKGICWGDSSDGGDCTQLDFQGVTAEYATRNAFFALKYGEGKGICWGDNGHGGDYSQLGLQAVSAVYVISSAFLPDRCRGQGRVLGRQQFRRLLLAT